jgi:hypothetical protein
MAVDERVSTAAAVRRLPDVAAAVHVVAMPAAAAGGATATAAHLGLRPCRLRLLDLHVIVIVPTEASWHVNSFEFADLL